MKRIEKIIFMGTPEFSVPTLKKLLQDRRKPQLVITQPDRKRGRGQKLSQSPVKEFALEHDLEVYQPHSVNTLSSLEKIQAFEPDLIVTAAFGKILKNKILSIPKYGCINLHPSLLPKYRGPSPINWALFHGDSVTGTTVFYMNSKMDAGDIILQGRLSIQHDDNFITLSKKLSEKGANDIVEAISLIEQGKDSPVPQNDRYATYSHLITRKNRQIKWHQTADEINNQIRGLAPQPGAFSYLKEKEIKILKATPTYREHSSVGRIVEIEKQEGFLVSTGYRLLLVREIKPQGKPAMSAYAYSLGVKILHERFKDKLKTGW
ncbi:MAG: methionyl-tRNA formyltransferase [Candidatus Celaenobacter antarcticus]|nr:methionyl-tRNA formyltransferase [Candidatus Celaenobacter antarcticus]MDP8315422.1 methionyl-tRNA formyltransferase [Candidatus Celaenobacter antarcticus]